MDKFWIAITGVFVVVIGLVATGISYGESDISEIRNGTIHIANQSEADFPALARLTFDQAVQKALDTTAGQVLKTELEDENGFLVYNIEVVTPEKNMMEVMMDAGSGKILATEKDHEDKNENESGD